MINWVKLIEEKREELFEAGIQAYKDAWESRNLRFIVDIGEGGEISSWYDIAGGNSFHDNTYKVIEFCAEYWEIPDGEIEYEYKKFDINEYAAGAVDQQIDNVIAALNI